MTISRDDIEAKALELVDAVEDTTHSVRNKAIIAAAALAVLVAGVFIFGRRRGAHNKTIVEVYRV